ncbi:MAG: hypothetical protein SFU86_21370 [Pirellulaceae bacterium]|nr:hypothetical protein [Pirellulaceae bacterium]
MSTADSTSVPPKSSLAGKALALVGVVVSCVYLANLGAGIFPELPDNIPGIGNLDEVFFSGLLFVCLGKLGISMLPGLPLAPSARTVETRPD